MTKVAEDYRSAPERSSHPLLAPQGSDFSRWWELEPEKTLAGLGPFAENESVEDGSDILACYLADAADDDGEGNEPTRLLARSAVVIATADSTSAVPANATLDATELDELARRIRHDSVLRSWIHSSPAAAAPSLLVPIKVPRAEAPPSAPPTPTLEPLWRTVTGRLSRRPRVSATVAGLAVVAMLLLLLLSRLGGAQASAGQLAPRAALAAVSRATAATQASPVAPVATFITLPAGETERDVPVEREPKKPLPSLQSPRGAAAPVQALPASLPVATAMPAPQTQPAGETLVRVKTSAKPLAAGSAALRLNSIPFSTVVVDGRTQGLTPRLLQVTPGVHAVVFVHPELGRRLVSVDVADGTTAVAAVKF